MALEYTGGSCSHCGSSLVEIDGRCETCTHLQTCGNCLWDPAVSYGYDMNDSIQHCCVQCRLKVFPGNFDNFESVVPEGEEDRAPLSGDEIGCFLCGVVFGAALLAWLGVMIRHFTTVH